MHVVVSLPHVLSNKFQNLKIKEFGTKRAYGSALVDSFPSFIKLFFRYPFNDMYYVFNNYVFDFK